MTEQKFDVFLDSDVWLERAERIDGVLNKAIAEYKQGNEALKFHKEWESRIRQAAYDYMMREPVFERRAETRNSLKKLEQSLAAFCNELNGLPVFAKLILDIENDKYGLCNFESRVSDFENIISTALLSEEERDSVFKAQGIVETQNKRRPLDSLLKILLEAYQDISGREFGLSRNPIREKPSGPLFNFVFPFVVLFEPSINEETLLDRIRQVYEQDNLINKIT